jgi:hypothetical protein
VLSHVKDKLKTDISETSISIISANICLLGFCSTLKTEAEYSHETSINFYQISQHHIPEDSTVHGHYYETLKSHTNGHVL